MTTPQKSESATEKPDIKPLLASIPVTQALLGDLGRSSVYKLCDNQELESVWIGKRHFVTRASIARLANKLTGAAA